MNVNELYQILQPMYSALGDTRTLNLDVTPMGVNALSALFTTYLGGTTLVINRLEQPFNAPSVGTTQFQFDGHTDLLLLTEAKVRLIFAIDDNTLSMTLTIFLNAAWRFSNSFPLLKNTPYDSMHLSQTANDAVLVLSLNSGTYQGITLESGLNFYGTLDFALGIFDAISWFFDDHTPSPAHGSLTWVDFPLQDSSTVSILNVDIIAASVTLPSLFTSYELPIDLRLFAEVNEFNIYERGLAVEGTLTIDSHPIVIRVVAAYEPLGVLVLEANTNLSLPSPAEILRFFGVSSDTITTILPAQFSGGNLITLSSINFGIGTRTQKLEYAGLVLKALDGETWKIIPNGILEIGNVYFEFIIFNPMDSSERKFFAQFSGHVTLFDIPIVLTARLPSLFISGQLDELEDTPSIKDVVESMFGHTKGVPEDLYISELSFGAQPSEKTYSFRIHIEGEWEIGEIGSAAVSITELALEFEYIGSQIGQAQKSGFIRGGLQIGNALFIAEFNLSDGNQRFIASWENRGQALGIVDIVEALGFDAPSIPTQFDLGLIGATFSYDITNKVLLLKAESINYGEAIFIAAKLTDGWVYAFGVNIHPGMVSFSQLPLIGDKLPAEASIEIKSIQLLAVSHTLDNQQITTLNQALSPVSYSLPSAKISVGLNVAVSLQFGTTPHNLVASATSTDTSDSPNPSTSSLAPVTGNNVTWYKIQRSFGPVRLERIGFEYQHPKDKAPKINFLVDAAISVAGLTLGLEGLSAAISLDDITALPTFELRGLGIAYKASQVDISGAFLRSTISGEESYSGKAIIKTKTLMIGAIGSYAELESGPSLFIYAFLNYPIGGPPFLFVEGLAAGFGYNRRLTPPTVEKILDFPLIVEATRTEPQSTSLAEELNSLSSYISFSAGDYFLAAGVNFTSFKMIRSFVLLTVGFGHRFEVNVFGISTLTLPAPDPQRTSVTPIAEIQLALRATFVPEDGFLGLTAQLTSKSFLLSRDCHLTGGFAFYTWFKGQHQGDFVLTVGGYHPRFQRPEHYPIVPRLGFNWRVDEHLTFKGSAYFALTPTLLMAGGSLNAIWQDGKFKAWFDTSFDFLIAWKPYHYEASAHINIGASYIDETFGRHEYTAHVSADVNIWGPEFQGTAYIDLTLVSFTIRFGPSGSPSKQALEWTEFSRTLLPSLEKLITINLVGGAVHKDQSSDDVAGNSTELGVVNPKEFFIIIETFIPNTSAKIGNRNAEIGTNFGIGPMGKEHIDSTFSIEIVRLTEEQPVSEEDSFSYQPITRKLPFALWSGKLNPELNDPQLIPDLLTGYEIRSLPPLEPIHKPSIPRLQPKDMELLSELYFRWTSPTEFVPSQDDAAQRINLVNESLPANATREAIAALVLPTIEIDLGSKPITFFAAPEISNT
jgi:hypothetical protein